MEDNTKKYYTPTIDEFHVGFEYEFLNGDKWEKDEITTKDFSNELAGEYENWFDEILKGIRDVRVKYLDEEDIKSLGFAPMKSIKNYQENFMMTDIYRSLNEEVGGIMWINARILYNPDIHKIIIYGEFTGCEEERFFEGTIKNKSELKKILEQLNIIEKI